MALQAKGLPTRRKLTIVAQDPSVRVAKRILTTDAVIPAEELAPGPCGYRVNVVDYDASRNILYEPASYESGPERVLDGDPFEKVGAEKDASRKNRAILEDPRFHAQNAYAIVMRTLAQFEFALGRRVNWGCDGHQLHIAPHAFADANAFYSRDDRAIFFGYFTGRSGETIFTCLAHDVVAHETTHAILDGLRGRYLEPSSPDQAAFHEGFADVVALLSVFSLSDVVGVLLDGKDAHLIDERVLTKDALKRSVLLGLADQMGAELSGLRGSALRRSVELAPGKPYRSMPEYAEPHNLGELLVAAMLNAFLDIWLARLAKIGTLASGKKDRSLVVEEGARVANHLLTIAIRAIDYCPPTDITFSDYLSAMLTIDQEVVPDDSKYGYRDALLGNFAAYDIAPASRAAADGAWKRWSGELVYSRTHFDSMLRDREEVFRFLWENRVALNLDTNGYIEVESVKPCYRIAPDGFILQETVAQYVQIMTLMVSELKGALGIDPPPDMPKWQRVRVFGGGVLIFDEYGQLKYKFGNRLEDSAQQTKRLEYLWETGFFDRPADAASHFAMTHRIRALSAPPPREPPRKRRRK